MPTKVTVKDFENFSFSKSLETILEIVSPDKDQQDSKLHWNMESVEGLDPRLNCVCNPIELAIVLDLVAKSSKNSTILETYFTKFKRSFSTWKASGTNRTSFLPKETSVRHPADGLGRFPGTRQSRPGKAGYPTRTTDSSRTEVGSTREPPDTTR